MIGRYDLSTVPVLPGALCAQTDSDLWFPLKGEYPRVAKALCARCPVQRECLDGALERDEPYGVWGGLTRQERLKLRRVA